MKVGTDAAVKMRKQKTSRQVRLPVMILSERKINTFTGHNLGVTVAPKDYIEAVPRPSAETISWRDSFWMLVIYTSRGEHPGFPWVKFISLQSFCFEIFAGTYCGWDQK